MLQLKNLNAVSNATLITRTSEIQTTMNAGIAGILVMIHHVTVNSIRMDV